MSGRFQPLNGADAVVPARVVAHSTVEPSCYGCGWNGKPCSQACSACGCRWSGDPMSASDECPASSCICHDDAAEVCTNCQSITTDVRIIEFGRQGLWTVCGTCLDKWAHTDVEERVAS